jgi:hypothetical protein
MSMPQQIITSYQQLNVPGNKGRLAGKLRWGE